MAATRQSSALISEEYSAMPIVVNKSLPLSMSEFIRPLSSRDREQYVKAAKRSRRFHHPWTKAPCDDLTFASYLSRFDQHSNHGFVVIDPDSGDLAGAIHLTNIVFGAFKSGYLGYFAFEGFQGKGHMRKGLQAVVRYAFRNLRLHRLEANIQPGNLRSIALVRTVGFELEGYSPAYLKIGGKWRDHERWAIVRR